MVSSDKHMDFINNSIGHFLHLIFHFKLVSRDYCSDEARMADSKRQQRKQEKMEVIKEARKNPVLSIRELCQHFDCGKTQITSILKDKDKWISLYEANASENSCQTSLRARKTDFGEANEILYKWYLLACSKNIYPRGPQLTANAKEIAECLSKGNFKGSNGWLDKWKRKYNVKQLTISGESGDVSGVTV